jgi:glutathione S-transferase
VRIFLAEKGEQIPTVEVDLRGGGQLDEEFRERNPDCTVPALELDDGTVISESFAICQYLESVFPEPPLLGRDAAERARATMWNARIEFQGLSAIAEAFRNHAAGFRNRALTGPDDYEQIPALVPRGRQRTEAFMRRMDEHLGDNEYVLGDYFSIADITAMVAIDFSAWIKLSVPAELAALRRWHESVSARPSARV